MLRITGFYYRGAGAYRARLMRRRPRTPTRLVASQPHRDAGRLVTPGLYQLPPRLTRQATGRAALTGSVTPPSRPR